MANEYIISKWRLWFRAIDINRRGMISKSDVRQEADTFATLSHLEDDKRKEFQAKLENLWDECVFKGKSGPINEQEFVDIMIRDYEANKDKFIETMRNVYTALFGLIDINQEGFVYKKEFVNIMRACGHENVVLLEKLFNEYNPVDGKVKCSVLADFWIQFTSSDDSSKKDVLKNAFEDKV